MTKNNVTNNTKTNRNECPMRNKENGNCYPIGGFCSAVNDNICRALKNAYEDGVMDCVCRIMTEKKMDLVDWTRQKEEDK